MTTPATPAEPNDDAPKRQPAPAHVDRIVLTGFMGSGKTTTGRSLAAALGWQFLDLDHEIERRDGRSVPQIFAEAGEAHFRRQETAALASLLGQHHVVIALGGGAPEELGNRLLLEQTPRTAVVYLTGSLDVLLTRCRQQAAEPNATARPVLADLDLATARFHKRRPHYERIADHAIDTDERSPEAAVTAILQALNG
jgi:shikimate kinase